MWYSYFEVIKMTTGELIQQRRKAKGLTQKQLAEMLGVAEITIRQYETNKREPKIDKLSRIADALGAYLGDLIPDWSAYPKDKLKKELTHSLNQIFWTAHLADKLKQIGCELIYIEDEGMIWLETPEGALEVTESDLKELDDSTASYLQFKISELIKKHPKDFRPK